MRTGAARPGAVISPATPAFRQLKLATEDAARGLGYDTSMRAAVRGFLEARLDALWAGPAGLFLEGGHPVGLERLLRGNVLVTGGQAAASPAGWKSCCPGRAGSSGRYRRARRVPPPRLRTCAGPRPDSIRPR
jgi:hypothetical protein